MSGIGERAFHPIPRTGGAVAELLDVLRFLSFDVRHKTHTTSIVLMVGLVQTLGK